MATFACVTLPAQFITPPPSTSNDIPHNDSDTGSSSGASEMKASETLDECSSTSSQQSPEEYPSPPPSHTPPESMASLQAESPTGDEDAASDVVQSTSSAESSQQNSPENIPVLQPGYHAIQQTTPIPAGANRSCYFHVPPGEALDLINPATGEIIGRVIGPATIRFVGTPAMLSQPLPLVLPDHLQCHQFADDMATQMGGSGGAPHNGHGSFRGNGRGGHHSNGNGRGGYGNVNGNGNHRYNNGNHNGNYNHGNNGTNGTNDHGYRGNGNYRGNPRGHRYNGRGRGDYQGRARGEQNNYTNHTNHHVQELPQIPVNIPSDVPIVTVNLSVPEQVEVTTTPNIAPGQVSLLGEPSGMTVSEMQAGIIPPGMFQPQGMPMNNMGVPIDITSVPPPNMVVPMTVNGDGPSNTMHPIMFQDPSMPGTSIGVTPQAYGLPPPGMMIVPADSQFNNNKWLPFSIANENEGLIKCLERIKPPAYINACATEVEFRFDPLTIADFEIEECRQQYYQIDLNEVAYQAYVFDTNGVLVNTLEVEVIEAGGQFLFSVRSLHPHTPYDINLQAGLPSRGLFGKPSDMHRFHTAPGCPEAPKAFKTVSRGLQFVTIVWHPSVNNGAYVSAYNVYIQEGETEKKWMLPVNTTLAHIPNLQPSTCYHLTVHAVNAIGESIEGSNYDTWTKTNEPPLVMPKVKIEVKSHRSIQVQWLSCPNYAVSIELFECKTGMAGLALNNFRGNTTVIAGLFPDSEYQMRVRCHNSYGNSYTKWYYARTHRYAPTDNDEHDKLMGFNTKYSDNDKDYFHISLPDLQPAMPYFVRYIKNVPKMAWQGYGPPQHEHSYVAEGSTLKNPNEFVELYRGNSTSIMIVDSSYHFLRVYHVLKDEVRTPASEAVVIPRECYTYRPECLSDVRMSLQKEGCVKIEWKKLNTENMIFPESSELIYFVQRTDLAENQVFNVGDQDYCIFENIPGETTVIAQVCASLSIKGELTNGYWSAPIKFTTPRVLPLPVINVKFDYSSSALVWNCLDKSEDLEYTLKVVHLPSKKNIMKVTTKNKNMVIDPVHPGESYSASVISSTSAGRAPKSTSCDFTVPALKPTKPTNVTLSHIRVDGCTVSWTASQPNGARITGYIIRLLQNGELFREHFAIANETETNYKYVLKELNPKTGYTIIVAARNIVGFSEKVERSMKTQPNIPTVPQIYCDCEPTFLKVHWEHVNTGSDVVYKLVRVNEHGQMLSVYEGENVQTKVKGLQEDTVYSFKLRVFDRITGAEAWSNVLDFSTTIAPPPTVKKSPTSTLVAGTSYSYRIEWQDCLPQDSKHYQFYRLQHVDATIKGAKWETAYEGKLTNFVLETKSFPGALHVRVMCVRKQKDDELKGSPSPVAYIANIPPPVEEVKVENVPKLPMFNFAINTQNLAISLFAVVLIIAFSASFSEQIFAMLSGAYSSSSSVDPSPKPAYQPPK